MRLLLIILILATLSQASFPQTYRMYKTKYTIGEKATLYASKIHEITLHPDSTFEFWSRPLSYSCFTWFSYKGTWKRKGDTVYFYDSYVVRESESRTSEGQNGKDSYQFSFSRDDGAELKNKKIYIEYDYDYEAKLASVKKIMAIDTKNRLEISYSEVPHRDQLASISVKYELEPGMIRQTYVTSSGYMNKKDGELSNDIKVEFVTSPRSETVTRTIKGVIEGNTLVILTIGKSKITLPDYHREIDFEDEYLLLK